MVRLDTPQLRKSRGAFFTPDEVAQYMAQWAIREATDRVLEPSCGEASFLLAAASELRRHGLERPSAAQLVGVELHEASAANARVLLDEVGADHTILHGDYFTTELPGPFDAVIGNPPYIRYQDFTGAARTRSREAALSVGVNLTGLSSSWAAFVVHASTQLAANGRMALVLPAELLTVNYAADVRQFLLDRFASVQLVTFKDLVFPDALEEVVLLLADGRGSTDHFKLYQASTVDDLVAITTSEWTKVAASGEGKWVSGLLPAATALAYRAALETTGFGTLADWGRPYLGAVTGNNRWFALTDKQAQHLGLRKTDVVRLSPPGSRHLRGLTFTDKAWEQLRKDGKKVWLFRPDAPDADEVALRIAEGEAERIHTAYKCRVRDPWWRVPLVQVPDLMLTYMNHVAPQLVANRARVQILNSIHGVKLHAGGRQLGMDLLPMAMLNSLTLLGAELVGRSYGGGMLKLEPTEAANLPLPSYEHLERCSADLRALRPQLTKHLRQGDLVMAAEAVDRVLFRGAAHLDRHQRKTLREGREALFERRRARGASSRGS